MIGCKVLGILGGILFAIGAIVGLLNLAMSGHIVEALVVSGLLLILAACAIYALMPFNK